MMSTPGPSTWFECVTALYEIMDLITPSRTTTILDQFVDVAIEEDWDDDSFDPGALSDMIRFASGSCVS